MSDQISWVLEVAILPGKLDDFRAVVRDLVASTRNEPGTLIYEYFVTADGTICHIYERYKDSAAVVAHVQTFGRFAGKFMEACRPTHFYVYGTPTDEARAAIADLGPVFLSQLDGFSR